MRGQLGSIVQRHVHIDQKAMAELALQGLAILSTVFHTKPMLILLALNLIKDTRACVGPAELTLLDKTLLPQP